MKRIYKYFLIFLSGGIGAILLMVLTKTFIVFLIYSFVFSKISSAFGLDFQLARAIAILGTIGSLAFLPWIISFLLFGTRKKDLLIASVAVTVCYLALYYGTANVFFDRRTGLPAKYYIVKEYFFWQKTDKLKIC